MKNEELIKKLEKEYKPDQETSIELDFPHGIGETNYHRGTWRGHDFTCTSNIEWKRGRLKTDYMSVSDLVDLLRDKDMSEISSDDLQDLNLVETQDGSTDVTDIEWDGEPTEEELEELNVMDLYSDSEITDCEYDFAAGMIGTMTVQIRKDTLVIGDDGYELTLAPRIRKWTKKDKDKLEARTLVAVAGMMEVQSTYDLLLESEVTDNLPHVDVAAHEAPVLRVKSFDVVTETDVLGQEVISLVFWAQNGPAVRMVVTGLADAIRLRNMLGRQVDGFGRPYGQGLKVDDGWEPPAVDYDFGDDEDEDEE